MPRGPESTVMPPTRIWLQVTPMSGLLPGQFPPVVLAPVAPPPDLAPVPPAPAEPLAPLAPLAPAAGPLALVLRAAPQVLSLANDRRLFHGSPVPRSRDGLLPLRSCPHRRPGQEHRAEEVVPLQQLLTAAVEADLTLLEEVGVVSDGQGQV